MKEAVATLKRLCRQRTVLAWKQWRESIERRPRRPPCRLATLRSCAEAYSQRPAAPVSHPLGSCCAFVGRGMTRSLPVRQTGCPSP